MKKKRALLIYVKNPKLGYCKTRLAKTVGEEKALDIYMQLLEHTKAVTLDAEADKFVFYSDYIDDNDMWSEGGFIKNLQPAGDIGTKMHQGFEEALQDYKQVILVGSDIAQLTSKILEDAFEVLDENDVVLGPALDGGYYLIGLKNPHKSIFELSEWSTPDVLGETLDKIEENDLTFNFVETLSDIDYEEDWIEYGYE